KQKKDEDLVYDESYLKFKITHKTDKSEWVKTMLEELAKNLNGVRVKRNSSYHDLYNLFANVIIDAEIQKYLDKVTISAFQRPTKVKGKKFSDIISPNGKIDKIDKIVKAWLAKYSRYLFHHKSPNGKPLLENTTKNISEDVKSRLHQIIQPAYQDFDLPPTIDPDYYFFQYKKIYVKNRPKDFTQQSIKIMTDHYKEYSSRFYQGNSVVKEIEEKILKPGNSSEIKDFQFEYPPATAAHSGVIENTRMESNGDKINIVHSKNGKPSGKEGTISPKQGEFVLTYGDIGQEEGKVNDLLISTTAGIIDNTTELSMAYAFPVYKLYFIEEDETEFLAPFRQDFNDMFGINAVSQIQFVEHSDQPADLLTVSFVDMTGKFTSAKYKSYAGDEKAKSKGIIDTVEENPLDGSIVQEGTNVQLRLG
ncbi:hypothetical protein COY62_04315, partial [bacterium (Candidatus Howlettbacteria) CG_4_10_14_0_8_um_filter_40_9]